MRNEFERLRPPQYRSEVREIFGKRSDFVPDNDGNIRAPVGARSVCINILTDFHTHRTCAILAGLVGGEMHLQDFLTVQTAKQSILWQ
jgi:hypothetical protein